MLLRIAREFRSRSKCDGDVYDHRALPVGDESSDARL